MAINEDLIFHIVSNKDWQNNQRYGVYRPELREKEGFIHCATADQIEDVANRYFKGQNNILLVVIDFGKIKSDVKMEDTEGRGEEYPHIYGPLNLDAVLDKIKLHSDQDGLFQIDFSSK